MSASHELDGRARKAGLALVTHTTRPDPTGNFAEVDLELMTLSNSLGALRLVMSPAQCQALAAALTRVATDLAAKRA